MGKTKRGARRAKSPIIGREAFARISAVEGVHLDDEGKRMFAEFDRLQLSPEERRRAIAARFTAGRRTPSCSSSPTTPVIGSMALRRRAGRLKAAGI